MGKKLLIKYNNNNINTILLLQKKKKNFTYLKYYYLYNIFKMNFKISFNLLINYCYYKKFKKKLLI